MATTNRQPPPLQIHAPRTVGGYDLARRGVGGAVNAWRPARWNRVGRHGGFGGRLGDGQAVEAGFNWARKATAGLLALRQRRILIRVL